MTREFLKGIKSENRINNIRLIMLNDPVIGGQPSHDDKDFTSNTPLLDLACTMKFSIDLGNEALQASKKAQETADEAYNLAQGAGSNANNRVPKKDVLVARDSSKEKVVSGFLLEEVENNLIANLEKNQKRTNIASKNSELISNALVKLQKESKLRIVCIGDSITYGFDRFSNDILPPLPGHVHQRAPIQYPQQLERELKRIYSTTDIKVMNYGYSGDNVQRSYEREEWRENPHSDIAVIMFGLNDSNILSISEYYEYFVKWIERLNDWGTGVIIAISTLRDAGGAKAKENPWRDAAKRIGDIYGCPIFTTDEFTENYRKEDIYSDATHFNKEGYKILGNTLAWFISKGIDIERIGADRIIQVSEFNVVTNGTLYSTSQSYNNNSSRLRLEVGKSQKATFPIYLDCEAAELFISGYISKDSEIVIDSDSLRASTIDKRGGETTHSYSTLTSRSSFLSNQQHLYVGTVVGRGWHSISITSPRDIEGALTGTYVDHLKVKPISQSEYSKDSYRGEKHTSIIFDPPINNALGLIESSDKDTFRVPLTSIPKSHIGSGIWAAALPFRITIIGGPEGVAPFIYFSECIVHPRAGKYEVLQISKSADNSVVVSNIENSDTDHIQVSLNRPNAGWIKIIIEAYDTAFSYSLLSRY